MISTNNLQTMATFFSAWKTKTCIALLSILAISFQVNAQMASITPEQYNEVKKIQFKDLDKETYMKTATGIVADRLDMKPPYVFNFSDGAERKIYLFKTADAKSKVELSMLAVYKNMKTGKTVNVCIPVAASSKQIWGLYIDDLKEVDKMDYGLSSCLSFALTKELSSMSSGSDSSKVAKEDDYEFCFPSNALVTLKSGEKIEISQVKAGDMIQATDVMGKKKTFSQVEKVIVHEGRSFDITKIQVIKFNTVAGLNRRTYFHLEELEATANHPVMTNKGVKKVGELKEGDFLIQFDPLTNVAEYVEIVNLETASRKENKVYNLETTSDNYLINNFVVRKK